MSLREAEPHVNELPDNVMYTSTHEWVRRDGPALASIGVTHFARQLLGEITFIAFPRLGDQLQSSEPCAVVESAKIVCDVRTPLSGTVTATNTDLVGNWHRINQQPYASWLVQIRLENLAETSVLLDASAYDRLVQELVRDPRSSSRITDMEGV
jgi:glycine cleavage system H protein